MSQIKDSEHLEDIRELLTYDENTAGGLMAKELVKVKRILSVLKCLNAMRTKLMKLLESIQFMYWMNKIFLRKTFIKRLNNGKFQGNRKRYLYP